MQAAEKIAIVTVVSVTTVIAVKQYRSIKRNERAKRVKIKADAANEIIALHRATAVVQDRIRRGHYDGRLSISNVMTDFMFERIVQNET